MHLVEVLVAAAVFASAMTTLPGLLMVTARAAAVAAHSSAATLLAVRTIEELSTVPLSEEEPATWVELLDGRGDVVPRPPAAYVRHVGIAPLTRAPAEAVVLSVVVTPYSPAAVRDPDARGRGAVRLTTIRRRGP